MVKRRGKERGIVEGKGEEKGLIKGGKGKERGDKIDNNIE